MISIKGIYPVKLIATVLFVLLVSSIALNVYLFGQLHLSEVAFFQEQTDSDRETLKQSPAMPTPTPPDPIDTAFEQRQAADAITLLQTLSNEVQQQKHATWFDTLYGRINTHQHNLDDVQFIQAFLQYSPYDPHFLLLEIMANIHRDEPAEQLALLYELRSDISQTTLFDMVTGQITDRLRYSVEQLIQVSAWEVLASLLESLLSYEPDNRYMLINLANAYAETRQYGLMESTLAYLPQEDKDAQQLLDRMQQDLARPQPDRQIASGIPLRQSGDHFSVTATLNNLVSLDLMIDTGASTSVISQGLFDALPASINPAFIGRYPVNTAGGKVMAPIYRFRSLAITHHAVDNIAIVVLPIEGLEGDGLLGMNFLRAFHFQIDQENSELFLSER